MGAVESEKRKQQQICVTFYTLIKQSCMSIKIEPSLAFHWDAKVLCKSKIL